MCELKSYDNDNYEVDNTIMKSYKYDHDNCICNIVHMQRVKEKYIVPTFAQNHFYLSPGIIFVL